MIRRGERPTCTSKMEVYVFGGNNLNGVNKINAKDIDFLVTAGQLIMGHTVRGRVFKSGRKCQGV